MTDQVDDALLLTSSPPEQRVVQQETPESARCGAPFPERWRLYYRALRKVGPEYAEALLEQMKNGGM